MKKRQQKPLRLGSFEQLESRALLAHAGLPQGLMLPEVDTRPDPDFDRGPRMEMHSRDIPSFDRGPREVFRAEAKLPDPISAAPVYQVPAAIIFVPTTPVIVIVTFPVSPIVTQPSFSAPVRNSTPDSGPSSFVSSLSSPASDRASNFSPPVSPPTIVDRPSSTPTSHRGSLPALTGLALGLVATREVDAEETTETTTPLSSERKEGEQLDEESQLAARQAMPAATVPGHQDTDEEDLIELDQEELRKRAKRKAAPPVVANDARRSNFIEQSRLPLRITELPRAELSQIEVEVVPQPISDDLIELLTNDQIAPEATTGSTATPFTAAALQLEANLGYHQAVEIVGDAAPTPDLPAAVAAAALPAREAQ